MAFCVSVPIQEPFCKNNVDPVQLFPKKDFGGQPINFSPGTYMGGLMPTGKSMLIGPGLVVNVYVKDVHAGKRFRMDEGGYVKDTNGEFVQQGNQYVSIGTVPKEKRSYRITDQLSDLSHTYITSINYTADSEAMTTIVLRDSDLRDSDLRDSEESMQINQIKKRPGYGLFADKPLKNVKITVPSGFKLTFSQGDKTFEKYGPKTYGWAGEIDTIALEFVAQNPSVQLFPEVGYKGEPIVYNVTYCMKFQQTVEFESIKVPKLAQVILSKNNQQVVLNGPLNLADSSSNLIKIQVRKLKEPVNLIDQKVAEEGAKLAIAKAVKESERLSQKRLKRAVTEAATIAAKHAAQSAAEQVSEQVSEHVALIAAKRAADQAAIRTAEQIMSGKL